MAKAKAKQSVTNKLYWLFVALRLILTLVPQTGYIHPDEFFQNVEILAGRTFDFEASLPWEFNVTSPIRSIGISYFTIGLSYQVIKIIDMLAQSFFNISLITPYVILVTPRIFICVLSYLIDYSLYMICFKNNEKSNSRLFVLSTSYVTLVYCTHTFTNTIEVILFALLLYYVSDSIIFSNILVRQREYLNNRYNRTENPADRAKFHKLRLFLASDSYRNCIPISTITVLGFFNRPTFVCYALFPVFFWLYRGIGYKSVNTLQFNVRILVLVIAAIPTIMFLIVVDSFFYGYISWGEIGMMNISIDNFVFPPLNFIKYNINGTNLAKHGLHPRYLHILVNVPLLFNILGVFAIFGAMDVTKKLLQLKFNLLPTVRSIKGLMTMSYIAPTMFLSLFPHQEPRFLLPIIIPLVYLFANNLYQEHDYDIMKAAAQPKKKEVHLDDAQKRNKMQDKSFTLLKLWTTMNILLTIFYGFLHQGGVLTAATYLSKEMQLNPHYNYHIVTSHIYSIPHVLFMQPDGKRLFARGNTKYKTNKHIFTYEEGSKDLQDIVQQVQIILNIAANKKRRYKMYLLMTGSKHDELMLMQGDNVAVRWKQIYSFYPHISTEALPDFSELMHIVSVADVKSLQLSNVLECIRRIFSSFDLKLYEVQLNTVVNI